MRMVVIESPYAGDVNYNVEYARAAMRDCLLREEAPFASHLLYTQVLKDESPEQRNHGIAAGLAIALRADATVVYGDLGISNGMQQGIAHANANNRAVEYRYLKGVKMKPLVYKHIKTDEHYVLVAGTATIEATGDCVVVYKSVTNGRVWVRPYAEFYDGRFLLIPNCATCGDMKVMCGTKRRQRQQGKNK